MGRYLFQGRLLDSESLLRDDQLRRAETPILAAGPGLPDQDTVHVFSSDEEFGDWATQTRVDDQVKQIKEKADSLLKRKDSYTKAEDEKTWAQIQKKTKSFDRLAKKTGQPVNSPDLLQRWVAENPELARDPVFIWDLKNFSGAWLISGGSVPTTAPWGWNDRISSSQQIAGATMFCQHEWFGGAKFWLFLIVPIKNYADFLMPGSGGQTWDNQISSWIST
jgi:hypothetical protein